jgi:hypothetical protein
VPSAAKREQLGALDRADRAFVQALAQAVERAVQVRDQPVGRGTRDFVLALLLHARASASSASNQRAVSASAVSTAALYALSPRSLS